MKRFDIGDILSVSTSKLMPTGMGGVYRIMSYLTGEELTTCGILMWSDKCKESLLDQHPQLKRIDPESINKNNVNQRYAEY